MDFGGFLDASYSSTSFDSPLKPAQHPGGFIASEQSDEKSPAPAKKRESNRLLPVTIKQLIGCDVKDKQSCIIDGKEITQVCLVGAILSIDVQQTHVSYILDDGTGKMNIRVFLDDKDETSLRDFSANTYVRVVGSPPRTTSGVRNIIAFTVRPITDSNEITYHFLHVIAAHERNMQSTDGGMKGAERKGVATFSSKAQYTTPIRNDTKPRVVHDTKTRIHALPPPVRPANAFPGMSGGNGFTPLQNKILDVFKKDQSETGTSISAVFSNLPHFSIPDIRKAIEFLTEEGHLYSTIDDEHFKWTNST